MSRDLESLQQELLDLDSRISLKLIELEKWFTELHVGVYVPLGKEFAVDKINGKCRFVRTSDSRPVTDLRRDDRARFLSLWGSKDKLTKNAESVLKKIVADRRALLSRS